MNKNKAYIIAFQRSLNYGAVLQIYALSKVIERLGVSVEVVDYVPRWMEFRLSSQPSLLSYIKRRLMKFFFRSFYRKMNLTSHTYKSLKELQEHLDPAAFYITGSDQVWNELITQKDEAYFLSFAPENAKKIGYAVSMGNKPISADFYSRVQELVLKFDAVSVREKYVADFVKSFRPNSDIPIVLDPTLLLDEQDYALVSAKKTYRQPYIAVYSCMHDANFYELARYFKKKSGLPLVNLGYHFNGADKHEYIFGSENWISRIKGAEYVLTNSFHGTVFSIIHRKKFMVVPNSDKAQQGLNARFVELLKSLGLSGRLVENEKEVDRCFDRAIDYDSAFGLLQKRREESLDYLKDALDICLLDNNTASSSCKTNRGGCEHRKY